MTQKCFTQYLGWKVLKPKRSEADVKSSVMKLLKSMGIMSFRLNTGAFQGEYKGKKRFVRFGVPGMADILAFPNQRRTIRTDLPCSHCVYCIIPTWIETKSSTGKQSEEQKAFQRMVEVEGHKYILARSADEVYKELSRIGT